MNMRSHLALAVYLSERLDLRPFAFIFGNVQPDLAVYSYLKGSTSGRKAHGHDYRNMLPRIVSVLSKLEHGKGEGIVHSYRLGKLMHYIADSFTFPHNEIFRGSLRAHMHYEDDLEIVLLNHLNEDYFQTTSLRAEDVMSFITDLHSSYIGTSPSAENDSSYIIRVAVSAAFALASSLRIVRHAVELS